MHVPRPTRADFRRLLALGVPVTLVQISLMAMGVEDCIIVGRLGAAPLGAIALGSIYFFTITSFGMGLLFGLEPVISQAYGANEPDAVARAFQRGLLIVGAFATLSALSVLPVESVLRAVGQRPELVVIVGPYLRVQAPSTYAFLLFILVRITLQAKHVTRPILVAIAAANAVNILLSIVLVYGLWGFPALGPVGSGIGTLIARFVMLGVLLAAAWSDVRPLFRWQRASFSAAAIANLLRLGAPAGVQILLEFGVFSLVGLLMGNLGAVAVAGHQMALNVASLTYMVPLGVSTAGSVLVGRSIGAGDRDGARRAAVAAMICGVGFMVCTSLLFTFAPRLIARAYTNDAAAIALAATLIPIAGVFQVFDGLQCVSIGLLRGTGDTRTPMFVNLFGYWCVGLPVSLWLGRGLGMGPVGLWWGLVAGLAAVAGVLVVRLRMRFGGPLERVRVEAPTAG